MLADDQPLSNTILGAGLPALVPVLVAAVIISPFMKVQCAHSSLQCPADLPECDLPEC